MLAEDRVTARTPSRMTERARKVFSRQGAKTISIAFEAL